MILLNLTWQSVERTYHVHEPANYQPGNGAVVVLHGGGGDGLKIAATSAMEAEADLYGFLAVFPNGDGKWNDGRENVDANKDDLGFLNAMMDALHTQYGVDRRRGMLCGASNGGLMTQRTARQTPSAFTAYASVSANVAADIAGTAPVAAAPVMMFNGSADTLMPWAGGTIPSLGEQGGGTVTSTMAVVDEWATKNEAAFYVEGALPNYDPADECVVYRRNYIGGKRLLIHYRVENGGHPWPGTAETPAPVAGNKTMDISATKLMCEFFRAHGL